MLGIEYEVDMLTVIINVVDLALISFLMFSSISPNS